MKRRARELIAHEREIFDLQIRHERELREQAEGFIQRALELQAIDTGRRLGDLNHAHSRAAKALGTYVAREKFDPFADEVRRALAEAKGATGRQNLIFGAVVALLTLLVAGLALVVRIMGR